MCLSPVILKRVLRPAATNAARIRELDSEPLYRKVSCGSCSECVSLKQEWLCQRAELMSHDHYVFMQTLTVSNDWILQVQVGNEMFSAFDITLFQNYIKRLRKYDLLHAPFKYIACVEYGGYRHRPHMHVLYFIDKNSEYWKKFDEFLSGTVRNVQLQKEASFLFWSLLAEWRVNVGSTRNPDYRPLCRFVSRFGRKNYDFHYVEPRITDRGNRSCVRYVTKYLLKYDDYIKHVQASVNTVYYDKPEVVKSRWNILKPRVFISKNFGVSLNETSLKIMSDSLEDTYINMSADDSRPYWYSPETGKRVLLSPYLVRRYTAARGRNSIMKDVHLIDGNIYRLASKCMRFGLYIYDKLQTFPRYDNDRDIDMYYKDLQLRRDKQKRILMKIKDNSNYDFYELE